MDIKTRILGQFPKGPFVTLWCRDGDANERAKTTYKVQKECGRSEAKRYVPPSLSLVELGVLSFPPFSGPPIESRVHPRRIRVTYPHLPSPQQGQPMNGKRYLLRGADTCDYNSEVSRRKRSATSCKGQRMDLVQFISMTGLD